MMMNALTKYRHVFLVGLQSNLVYRWNFLIRGFFSLARLAVVFILWGAAYAGRHARSAATRSGRRSPISPR